VVLWKFWSGVTAGSVPGPGGIKTGRSAYTAAYDSANATVTGISSQYQYSQPVALAHAWRSVGWLEGGGGVCNVVEDAGLDVGLPVRP
jgi:hypothetical protein